MKQKGPITTRKRKDGVSYLIAWRDAHAMPSQQAEAAQVMDTVMNGGL
jgi:hypothetical protein